MKDTPAALLPLAWMVTRDSECDGPEFFLTEKQARENARLGVNMAYVTPLYDHPPAERGDVSGTTMVSILASPAEIAEHEKVIAESKAILTAAGKKAAAPDQKAQAGDDLVSIGALMDELYWYHKKIQGASHIGKPWADLFKEEWTKLNDALSKRTRPGWRWVPLSKQARADIENVMGMLNQIGAQEAAQAIQAMLAAAHAEREGE